MSKTRNSSRKKVHLSPNLEAALKTSFLSDIHNPIVYNNFISYFLCDNVDQCKTNHDKKEGKMYLMTENDSFPMTKPYEICKLFTFFLISGEILEEKFFRVALYGVATANDLTSKKLVQSLKCYLKLHPPCDEKMKEYYKNVISANFQSHLEPRYFMFSLPYVLELLLEVLELPSNSNVSEGNISILAFFDEMAKTVIPGGAEEFSLTNLCRILDIMLDIIHQDLYMCLIKRFKKRTKLFKKDQPILSSVAWKSDVGCVNDHCKMAFKILMIVPEECMGVISRYIAMLAEVARISDQDDGEFYPNVGKLCNDFAFTLFSFILEKKTAITKFIDDLQPLWLKMLVSMNFLKIHDDKLTLSVIVSFIKGNVAKINDISVLNLKKDEQEVLLCLITSYIEFYHLNLKVETVKVERKPKFVFQIDHQRRLQDEAAFSELLTLVNKFSFDTKNLLNWLFIKKMC